MIKDAILTVLLAIAPHHTDNGMTDDERRVMLDPVAVAIADASGQDLEMASALVVLGQHETHYARYVLEGRCKDGPKGSQCDPDKQGNPRAAGPWQLWEVSCADRSTLTGQAVCAARMLRGQKERCRKRHPAGDWAGAFSGYRSIRCDWEPAAARAYDMRNVEAKIRKAL